MTEAGYTRSVRRNLMRLLDRVEHVEAYARRHAPELREALEEALNLARRNGLSGFKVLLIVVMGIFNPAAAIAQVLRYLDGTEISDPDEIA